MTRPAAFASAANGSNETRPDTGMRSTLPALAAHGARVEEVRGPGRAEDARAARGLRDAHDRAEVARVLDAEEEHDGARAREDLRDGNVPPPRDGEQVLRRARVGEALEDGARDQARMRSPSAPRGGPA